MLSISRGGEMKDQDKTKEELLDELNLLRERLKKNGLDDGPRATALRESVERNQAIVDALPDHLFVFDEEARFIDYRTSDPGSLLASPEFFIGKQARDILPPDIALLTERTVQKVLATGRMEIYAYSLDIQGQQRHFEARVVVSGTREVLAVVRDVTDRVQADAVLRDREEQLAASQRIAQIGSWRHDLTTGEAVWSDELLRILGFDPRKESADFTKFFNMVHPDDQSVLKQAIDDTVRTGNHFSVDYRFILPDGTTKILHAQAELVRDETGTRLMLSGTAQDITERKKAEKKLRESEEKFSRIFQQAPLLVTLSDLETGRLVDVNEKFLEISGFTREEAIGRNVLELGWISGERRDRLVRTIEEQGRVSAMELRLTRKDGSEVTCLYDGETITVNGKPHLLSIAQDITERKKAEERLRKTNDTLNALVRYSPLAIICTDAEANVMVWNPAAERIFGWSEAEVLYRKNPIVPPDKQEEYRALQDTVRKGTPYLSRELQRRKKDGSPVYLNASSAAVHDAQGNVIALLGILEDITERRKAAEALRRSETMLQAIIDTEPECVKLLDADGRLIMMNSAGLAMIEAESLEQVQGRRVFPFITYEYRKPFQELIKQVFEGRSGTLLFEVVGAKGTHRWLETHAVPFRNENDEITALLAVTRDVTARRQAEEKLRESEEFVRNILDTVDEGFIVIDKDFRILTANRAFCAHAGEAAGDIFGRHCYEVSHRSPVPCYESGVDCPVRLAFDTGEPHAAIHRHRDAKGALMFVETKAFPIKDQNGSVLSAIETVNNITEKHLLEEERLKTQKLEAIGTLAGGIAHDFNNLLQGVFGYISMAKMAIGRKERAHTMLEQAEQALHLSVNLTKQLLTFSKGGKPVKKKMDLRPVIENSAKFALSGSSVDYRITVDDGLRPVEADDGQIGQVVQNIVLNAEQSMPQGGTVTITARNVVVPGTGLPRLLESGDYVEVAIRDSGIGIPARHLARIFDPYFTTKCKGSGLGLATSYSIVRNHGGLIAVSSEPGQGTTVTLYLPATDGEPSLSPAPAATTAARKGNILLMDDDDVVRNVAGELIRSLGHGVTLAEHGEAAVAHYRAARDSGFPFDVVILDLTVRGGMGGKDALERIRAEDPGVRAVVSSGYSDDAVVADHRAHGFAARLTKPYELADLNDVLNTLLVKPAG